MDPRETIVSVAKVEVSRPGKPGCCWTYETGCGPFLKQLFQLQKWRFPGLVVRLFVSWRLCAQRSDTLNSLRRLADFNTKLMTEHP